MVESEVNAVIENSSAELKPEENKAEKVDAKQLKKRPADESNDDERDIERSAKKLRLEAGNGNGHGNSAADGVELNEEKNSKAEEEKMDCDSNVAEKDQEAASEPAEKNSDEKAKSKHIDKNTEIVGGLEMSVECASDKEPSDSEDDKKADVNATRPKTIIVKEKPNEGEVEVSGDEDGALEDDATKKTASTSVEDASTKDKVDETERKKDSAGAADQEDSSNSKGKTVGSEEKAQESNKNEKDDLPKSDETNKEAEKSKDEQTNDEKKVEDIDSEDDETPLEARRQSKKATSPKKVNSKKSVGEKKSRGRGRKVLEKTSESDHLHSGDESDQGKAQKESNDSPEIKTLKNFIKLAGIKVKSYDELFTDCKNDSEKADKLKECLEKNGVKGRPTAEKCKAAKSKREMSELNSSVNVSATGRVLRSRNAPKKTSPRPSTPESPQSGGDNHKLVTSSIVDTDTE